MCKVRMGKRNRAGGNPAGTHFCIHHVNCTASLNSTCCFSEFTYVNKLWISVPDLSFDFAAYLHAYSTYCIYLLISVPDFTMDCKLSLSTLRGAETLEHQAKLDCCCSCSCCCCCSFLQRGVGRHTREPRGAPPSRDFALLGYSGPICWLVNLCTHVCGTKALQTNFSKQRLAAF